MYCCGNLKEKYLQNIYNQWRAENYKLNWGDFDVQNPPFILSCNTLHYKKVWKEVGGFDEDFKYGQVGTTRLKDLVNMNDPNFDLFYDDYIRKIQGFGPAKYEKDRSFKMGGTRHYWVPLNDFPGNG